MAASGGVTRGLLRPGGGLSSRPPLLLVVGLLVVSGVCAYNYWSLSSQYGDLAKEIVQLQEHVSLVTAKRETAEKHVDALKQRLAEAGDHLGRLKVQLDDSSRHNKQQAHSDAAEIDRLRYQLQMRGNATKDELLLLKKELENQKLNNTSLLKHEALLLATISDLRTTMDSMVSQYSRFPASMSRPLIRTKATQSGRDMRGQLPLVDPARVRVTDVGMRGITVHPGGPLVFIPPPN